MAFWTSTDDKGRGYDLIREALETARNHLKDRQTELAKSRRNVAELEATCDRLLGKIAELERDQQAMDRGYIAMMGDVAEPQQS